MLVSLIAIGFWRTVPADPCILIIADVSDVTVIQLLLASTMRGTHPVAGVPTKFCVPRFVGVLIIIVVLVFLLHDPLSV